MAASLPDQVGHAPDIYQALKMNGHAPDIYQALKMNSST